MSEPVSLWTIYKRPRDYPQGYIARRHAITPGRSTPTRDAVTGPTLQAVRDQLPPGMVWLGREPDDDPVIVESWI